MEEKVKHRVKNANGQILRLILFPEATVIFITQYNFGGTGHMVIPIHSSDIEVYVDSQRWLQWPI